MRTHRKYDGKISSVSAGRWTAYAAAAAASTFAAAQSAEATIHYSGLVNSKIKGNGTGTFSLGSGGGFVYHSSFLDPIWFDVQRWQCHLSALRWLAECERHLRWF